MDFRQFRLVRSRNPIERSAQSEIDLKTRRQRGQWPMRDK